jgi:hypothetical protein
MQPKTTHLAWTTEEILIQVYGSGPWTIHNVNPVDDPQKKEHIL